MAEARLIRGDADSLGANAHIIYAGDFNLTSSSERGSEPSAWDVVVGSGSGQAFDAADLTNSGGDWRGNPDFLSLHSQDPRVDMDDRFDMQFVTDEFFDGAGLELVDGSYRVFGNDGTHVLDEAITTGSGADPLVLAALGRFSDHLPVAVDYSVITVSSVPEPSAVWLTLFAIGAVAVGRRFMWR